MGLDVLTRRSVHYFIYFFINEPLPLSISSISSVIILLIMLHLFPLQSHTTIWNGKKVVVYEVAQNKSFVRVAGKRSACNISMFQFETSGSRHQLPRDGASA